MSYSWAAWFGQFEFCGYRLMLNKQLSIISSEPLLLIGLPVSLILLLAMVIVRPFVRIRIGFLHCDRIGHFAANTELYLCERDAKNMGGKTLDLFYYPRKVCNQQLAKMWERKLHVLPWFWLRPLCLVVRSFDCLASYRATEGRGGDRDLDNLLDRFPPHIDFTNEEEERGKAGLRALGIADASPFVCLTVRDSAYLAQLYKGGDTSYQNYRDSDIQNYVLAAEALADRGYFVIRMGAKVHTAINSIHPKVIDYAANGMRSDFMDIYLGAKCAFCISTQTGFDAVPYIFRRPIVYVDQVPPGLLMTFSHRYLAIPKKHWLREKNRFMTIREIFESGANFFVSSSEYTNLGIDLIGNAPEEIMAVVLEMESRLKGTWQTTEEDEALQRRFWELFPKYTAAGTPLHGEIRSRIGADFLRRNRSELE